VIRGRLLDPSQAVIVGARVVLRSRGSLDRTATTDSRGVYQFDGVAPGAHELVATAQGFDPASATITLRPHEERSLDLVLATPRISDEVTVSVAERRDAAGLKFEGSLDELPFSIDVVGSGFIKTLDAKRLADVLPFVNGVSRSGDTAYDFAIRGIRGREPGNIQVDGLPGLPVRFGSPSVLTVERIEVLKGPASVLYGQIQPGGLINIVRKRPGREQRGLFDVRLGSYAGAGLRLGSAKGTRVAADVTGPMNQAKSALYRVMLSYDAEDSFRRAVDEENFHVAPVVSWTPSPATTFTFDAEYRHERGKLDDGLVAPANDINRVSDIRTRYQEPGDSIEEHGLAGGLTASHAFGATLWTTAVRSVYHDDVRDGYENVQVTADGRTLSRRDRYQFTRRQYHSVDSTLKWNMGSGPVSHRLLGGVTGGYELRAPDRRNFVGGSSLNINLANPVYGAAPPRPAAGFFRDTDFYRVDGYVQDQASFGGDWRLLGGARLAHQIADYRDRRSTAARRTSVTAVTPMVGLVYQPGVWSLYTSYATSFSPANPEMEDASGNNVFDPERGRQAEAGVRRTWWSGRLDGTLAIFQITRNNVLNTIGSNVSVQTGRERSRGAEVELRARPLEGLSVIAGYARTDAEIVRDVNPIFIGVGLPNAPPRSFTLWSRYDVANGVARGLGIGVGVLSQGERVGALPTVTAGPLRLPSFTRADLGVYYTRGPFDTTLRVTNLLDRLYYESAQSAVSIQPGRPREVGLSLRVRF